MAEAGRTACTYTIGGVRVEFPRRAYSTQLAMMNHIVRALSHREHGLLELPTGSGKSLALVCSALAWQRHEAAAALARDGEEGRKARRGPRVVIASRTHSQLKQLVRELRRTAYRPRVVVLGSREQLCTSKAARAAARGPSCGLKEACERALHDGSCSQFRAAGRLRHAPALEPEHVPDIEDVVAAAQRARACAYFGTRLRMHDAEVLLCPYNYIFDPSVRAASELDAWLKDAAILIDEAHNVEDVCREAASAELSARALRDAAVGLQAAREREGDEGGGAAGPELLEAIEAVQLVVEGLTHWLAAAEPKLRPSGYEREAHVCTGGELVRGLAEAGLRVESWALVRESWARVRARAAESGAGPSAADADGSDGEGEPSGAGAGRARAGRPGGAAQAEGSAELLPRGVLATLSSLFTVLGFMLAAPESDAARADAAGGKWAAPASLSHYACAFVRELGAPPPGAGGRAGGGGGGGGGAGELTLAFWCQHAAVAFAPVRALARSIVLTSGTLSPLPSLGSELGTHFGSTLQAGHVVPADAVCALTLAHGPGGGDGAPDVRLTADYQHAESAEFQDALGRLLLGLVLVVPGNLLVFLPSYALLHKLWARWGDTGVRGAIGQHKQMLREPRRADELGAVLQRFRDAPEATSVVRGARGASSRAGGAGAMLLAVYRGKVAEGIDFSDELCRAVVAVGLPFPHARELRVQLKRQHADARRAAHGTRPTAAAGGASTGSCAPPALAGGFVPAPTTGAAALAPSAAGGAARAARLGAAPPAAAAPLGGGAWYAQQAHRALNQAVGRVVRHVADFGALLLVDARHQQGDASAVRALSKWLQPRVRHARSSADALERVRAFFEAMEARGEGAAQQRLRAPPACVAAATSSVAPTAALREVQPAVAAVRPPPGAAEDACAPAPRVAPRAHIEPAAEVTAATARAPPFCPTTADTATAMAPASGARTLVEQRAGVPTRPPPGTECCSKSDSDDDFQRTPSFAAPTARASRGGTQPTQQQPRAKKARRSQS